MNRNHARRRRITWMAAVSLSCLLLLTVLPTLAQHGSDAPVQRIEAAWARAAASERYAYRVQVDQTTFPTPGIRNAGRAPRTQFIGVEGSVDLVADRLSLSLWQDASFDPDRAIALKVEDGVAYARAGNGAWEQVENVADLFAPGGDPLGFLAGMANVKPGVSREIALGETIMTAQQYLFDLNGPALAVHMRDQLEAQLQARGKLPAGVSLATADAYRALSGRGELWVDGADLPRRLVIDVTVPATETRERVEATIATDYFDFDMTQLERALLSLGEAPRVWLAENVAPAGAGTALLAALMLLTVALLSYRYWGSLRFYRMVVLLVTMTMLIAPLLQGHTAAAFTRERSAQQAFVDSRRAEASASDAWRGSTASDWQPHLAAIEQLAPAEETNPTPASPTDRVQHEALGRLLASTGPDSDGDGISDVDETDAWGTDPADVDSDGDGLEDGLEAYTLGTAPSAADTDGDLIHDGLEVGGFEYAGATWYLDPLAGDTNADGIGDGAECLPWVPDTALYDPAAPCPDTDNDGTPDVFDPDNDDDGVRDRFDLNTNSAGGQVFSGENQLELRFTNLETGRPVYVDFQFRPTNPNNLTLAGSVLDWPTGDVDGQFTRVLDTTFADTANPDIRSGAANAAYGDIRVTPVLEMVIPGTIEHYGNLPVNGAYSGTPRPDGVPVTDWLDTERLAPYGISVGDTGPTNQLYRDLLVYIPVQVQTDPESGLPEAFTARMLYQPEQGTVSDPGRVAWGSNHQVRLVWVVQMITDRCIADDEDLDSCAREDVLQVLHVYDESWTLTGLSVSEEHGVDVAIVYEDPALDPDLTLDDQLWATANSLNSTLLRARDIDGDGARDVQVRNLAAELPTWHDPASGPFYTGVLPIIDQLTDSDQIARVMMTDTLDLLNTTFAGFEFATAPTLLFAQEKTNRLMTLDVITPTNTLYAADFDPTTVFTSTTATMTWKPYEYVAGAWQNGDPAAYLDALDYKLGQDVFVAPSNATDEERDAAEGQRLWAMMYYATLYQGVGSLVESGGSLIWRTDAGVTESFYDPLWPSSTFRGASYAGTFFARALADALVVTIANVANIATLAQPGTSFWSAFKKGLDSSTTNTLGRDTLFPPGSGNITGTSAMTAAIDVTTTFIVIAATVGAAVFAYGFFTGDEDALALGTTVLNVVSLAVAIGHLGLVSYALYKLATFAVGGLSAVQALSAVARYQNFLQSSKAFGIIGFVIGVLVAWGSFLYAWLGSGFDANQIARNFAMATAIASTAIALVLLILDIVLALVGAFATAVGTIVVLLLAIVDSILALAGEPTLTERLTVAIAEAIYDIDYILANFNGPDRLSFDMTGFAFADEALGFTRANTFYPTFSITNTIEYRAQSSDNEARRSAFGYFVQSEPVDRESQVNGNTMRDAWTPAAGRALVYTRTITSTVPMAFTNPGLNQQPQPLYLTEAFAVPYQGCWLGLDGCTWEYIKGSSHIDIGSELRIDILPDTIAAFARVDGWGDNALGPGAIIFGTQPDLDNDGLLNPALGGADPDDTTADLDGDGVSDLVELTVGTLADDPDTDDDGLTDHDEIVRLLTDPLKADTDGDGLSDYVEVELGWLTPTATGGGVMRVWSNPFYVDADGDRLNDLQEYIYGFHPGVPTDPSRIANLVSIDEFAVLESGSPELLFRFEVSPEATTFVNESDDPLTAICAPDSSACPTPGVPGRYGSGLAFDADGLSLDAATLDFERDFSLGLWINTVHNSQEIASLTDGQGGLNVPGGEFFLQLDASGQPLMTQRGTDGVFRSTSSTVAVTDGLWHHIMLVWSADADDLAIYVDGVDVTNGPSSYAAIDRDPTIDYLSLGEGVGGSFFRGMLDDLVFFTTALSATEVADVRDGRLNLSDRIVRAGDRLTYQAIVTNSLLTQAANGFTVATSQAVSPTVPPPEMVFHFEAVERGKALVPFIGGSSTWTCIDNGRCPAGNGEFDGLDDFERIPTMNVREEDGISDWWDRFSITLHVRLDVLPPPGEEMSIIDTVGDLPGSLDVYVDADGWIWFDIKDTILTAHNVLAAPYGDPLEQDAYYDSVIGQHTAHGMPVYAGGQRLGDVVRYTFIYDQSASAATDNLSWLYVDYATQGAQLHLLQYDVRGAQFDGLRFGSGTFGSGTGRLPLDGNVNNLAYYNGSFDNTDANLSHMYFGRWRGFASDSPRLNPAGVFRYDGTESRVISYRDAYAGVSRAICQPESACPTVSTGGDGDGVAFDGLDDTLELGPTSFARTDYTLGVWFKTTAGTERPLAAAVDPADGTAAINLRLTAAGEVAFDHALATGGVTVTVSSGAGYNDGAWHYLTAVREGDTSTLYIDGAPVDSATGGGVAPGALELVLGRAAADTPGRFLGALDEWVVFPAALDAAAIDLLMQSGWPSIGIGDRFVPFAVAANTTDVVSGTADVADTVPGTIHRLDQEVEVALELQAPIDIPVFDANSANLGIFVPFEDVPGTTQFENIVDTNEYRCPIPDACPTAGLRGIVDRATLFDGEDDYLRITAPEMLSFSGWVNADRGVIFDTRQGHALKGIELDVGRLVIQSGEAADGETATSISTLPLSLPVGVWTHVVVALDKSINTAHVYINGALADSLSYPAEDPVTGSPTLGGSSKGGNYLNGYLDDFRAYDITLTAADALALYQNSAPVLRFEFDEDSSATTFVDGSLNRFVADLNASTYYDSVLGRTVTKYRPVAGTDGQIGNTALFDGVGIEIGPADDTPLDLQALTFMAWVQPDNDTDGFRSLIAKHNSSGGERNYSVTMAPGTMRLRFNAQQPDCATFIGALDATSELDPELWTHVAVTFDGSEAKIYLNGQLDATRSYGSVTLCENDHPLRIGSTFRGEMDELALYARALSAAELNSIYLRELRWYRAREAQPIIVDSDAPTLTLVTDTTYRAPGYTQLVVTAADPTSGVALLDVGVRAAGDAAFTWQGAYECEDAARPGAAWCPVIDTIALGGAGVYELQFRAVDSVGHQTVSAVTPLIVDDAPPIPSAGYAGGWLPAVPIPGVAQSWTITLTGTITEPVVGGEPGSGVDPERIRVSLVDGSGRTLDGAGQYAALSGGSTWEVGYVVAGSVPAGVYAVVVEATDRVGNSATTTVGSVRIDARAPRADVDLWHLPAGGVISRTWVLSGTASELPTWGDVLATYHFETVAPEIFYDSGRDLVHATCAGTACPTPAATPLGHGLAFDGVGDSVDVPNLFDPAVDPFSVSLWVKLDAIGPVQALVQQANGTGQGRTLLYVNSNGRLASNLGGFTSGVTVLNAGTWYHVLLTSDGAAARIYLDGVLDVVGAITPESADGAIQLGSNRGSAAFFGGTIDEVTFYGSALPAHAAYALAQSDVYGIAAVSVGFEPVDFAALTDTVTTTAPLPVSTVWVSATLATPGATVTPWTMSDDTLLENFYTVQVRSTDLGGNQSGVGTVWRGLIDRMPPAVTAAGQQIGAGAAAQTEYTIDITDFLLDRDRLAGPCDNIGLVEALYGDSVLPFYGEPYAVATTCRVPGWETADDVTACDAAGNCTSETIAVTPGGVIDSVAILTPTLNATLTDVTGTVDIAGGAFDADGVAAVAVTINGVPHGAVTFTVGITDTLWSIAGWQPLVTGTYTLSAVMTDTLGGTVTDTVAVTVAETLLSCADVAVQAGWNMVAVPLKPEDARVTTLFPDATSPAYRYTSGSGYEIVTSMTPGTGYWLKFETAQTVSICGSRATAAVAVTAGWNLIGVYEQSVATGQVTLSAGAIESPFYAYATGYMAVTTLEPGKAYWVKVSADGLLSWPLGQSP